MTNKETVIYNAVVNGTTIGGMFGGNTYNVMDLLTLNPSTLDGIYSRLCKLSKDLSTDSLINKSKKLSEVESHKELVETVFDIKKQQEADRLITRKELEDRRRKLEILHAAKGMKEVENISKLSVEDLEKQIAELS